MHSIKEFDNFLYLIKIFEFNNKDFKSHKSIYYMDL